MFILTKISLAITIILTAVVTAQIFGKMNMVYTIYIIMLGLALQILLFILFLFLILMRRNKLKNGIKIIRYKTENVYIKGGKDIIPKFITPTNPRKSSIFKIFVEAENFNNNPDFGICKIGGNNFIDIKDHILNARTGIINKSFIFDADIIVRPEEKINCKFKNDINIKLFFIGELYVP